MSATSATTAPAVRTRSASAGRLLAALLVCGAAIPLYRFDQHALGYGAVALGLVLAAVVDRYLFRHLAVVTVCLVVISRVSLKADLSDAGIVRFTLVLTFAVLVPYLVLHYGFADRAITFPWRGHRWGRFEVAYLAVVVVGGYLLLPVYFIGSGTYRNWPTVTDPEVVLRLFLGVNAVGLWDELFFICTVFALLRCHFATWQANLIQVLVFVSFLWELGYQSWGPAFTAPFALLQGYIFARTRSLSYVVTVHLSMDAIIFMILVHAHTPAWFNLFLTAPGGIG